MAEQLWSDDELSAAIAAYRAQWAAVEAGEPHRPTRFHVALSEGVLIGRTPGSVGRRMSNLSWVLHSSGRPYFDRYAPSLTQAGSGVKARVLRIFDELDAAGPAGDPVQFADSAAALALTITAPPKGTANPQSGKTTVVRFNRSLAVAAWVLKEADGKCEVCERPAPFTRPSGAPYLEVHHVHRLADGGPDTIENAIATCPNCHRHLHLGADAATILVDVRARVKRLA